MSADKLNSIHNDQSQTIFDQYTSQLLSRGHHGITHSIIQSTSDVGEQAEMKRLIAQLKLSSATQRTPIPVSPTSAPSGINAYRESSERIGNAAPLPTPSVNIPGISRQYSDSIYSNVAPGKDNNWLGLHGAPQLNTETEGISQRPAQVLQRQSYLTSPQCTCNTEQKPYHTCDLNGKHHTFPRRCTDPAAAIARQRAGNAEFGNINTDGLQNPINAMRASLSEPNTGLSSYSTLNEVGSHNDLLAWGKELELLSSNVLSISPNAFIADHEGKSTRSLDTLDLLIARSESARSKVKVAESRFERCTSYDRGSDQIAMRTLSNRAETPVLHDPLSKSSFPLSGQSKLNASSSLGTNDWIQLSTATADNLHTQQPHPITRQDSMNTISHSLNMSNDGRYRWNQHRTEERSPSLHAQPTAQYRPYLQPSLAASYASGGLQTNPSAISDTAKQPSYESRGHSSCGGLDQVRKSKPKLLKSTTSRSKEPQFCAHCGIDSTVTWRRLKGDLVCNACGLYFKSKGRMRPLNVQLGQKKKYVRQKSNKKAG